jgi:hypothetical protein
LGKLYRFFDRRRGARFAAACVVLHLLYYLYSGLSYLYVWVQFQLRRAASARLIGAKTDRAAEQ